MAAPGDCFVARRWQGVYAGSGTVSADGPAECALARRVAWPWPCPPLAPLGGAAAALGCTATEAARRATPRRISACAAAVVAPIATLARMASGVDSATTAPPSHTAGCGVAAAVGGDGAAPSSIITTAGGAALACGTASYTRVLTVGGAAFAGGPAPPPRNPASCLTSRYGNVMPGTTGCMTASPSRSTVTVEPGDELCAAAGPAAGTDSGAAAVAFGGALGIVAFARGDAPRARGAPPAAAPASGAPAAPHAGWPHPPPRPRRSPMQPRLRRPRRGPPHSAPGRRAARASQ